MRFLRRSILMLVVFFSHQFIQAQLLNLPLNIRAADGQFSKLILVTAIFEFRGDSVSNPLDISGAKPNDKVVWRKVVKPYFGADKSPGFAWVFDGSSDLDFAPSYTLIAIENVKNTNDPRKVWVDRNHNFDLTDDGVPLILTKENGLEISLGQNPQGYHVLLEQFPHVKFGTFAQMNDSAVTKVQGNRKFYSTARSFREKRLNVLAAKWTNGADSFCIGIKDVNCNGRYDDEGLDVVLITSYNGVFDNLQGVTLDGQTAYLEWNNAAYTIKKIDPLGNYIQVLRDTASRLKYSLNVGDKIYRFKYCSATKPSKHRSIRRLKGNYIFIYVWRDGEDVFLRDSGDWHELGRSKRTDFINLGLNYGASARYVYQYNNYYETSIRHGYSSNRINETLRIKQIPTGILLDKKQRIIAVGITPSQAAEIMKSR